ncbi:MAG: Rpn family recombination-promoting nuclease/putative transposase [Desulfobacterales bacterium]|nr:Rpn family recombination-promoting nuclease/putative transposase [Desulfobacterales bacterium]
MKSLLSPTLDLVFKKLFVKNSSLLIDLINTVLDLPEHRRILSVEIKNPIILPEEIIKKYIILDIRVTDNSGNQYDVEMQAQKFEAYTKRALYYLAKLYAGQLKSGDDYELLNPVIGIHFLNYTRFPEFEKSHFSFHFREDGQPELKLEDDMSLHIFELPKIKKMEKENPSAGRLEEWLHFFRYAHEEGEKTMRTHYSNPAIQEAFVGLEEMSADEKERQLAEMRETALKNKNSELGAARRKGREEGKRETAVNLISMGTNSMEFISQATGLSLDEVRRLRNAERAGDS